jgi:hypothetical protein
MEWGTYMLRKPFVLVFIRLRVTVRENPVRFEMVHRTPGNPTTVNRVRQPAAPMAWGTYMLRKPFVLVFIRLRVMARENPVRFEMVHRTPGNPTTVNRVRQPAAKKKDLKEKKK